MDGVSEKIQRRCRFLFPAWDDYKWGFGNLNGEFWLGLNKIHRLTVASSGSNKLRIDLEDIHGKTVFAEYSSFSVASVRAKYLLSWGSYSGEVGLYFFNTIWLFYPASFQTREQLVGASEKTKRQGIFGK